jgi:hypothetical protein
MDLPYQRLPLKIAAVIGDDLPQGRIKFCGVDVPGRCVRKMTYMIGPSGSYAIAQVKDFRYVEQAFYDIYCQNICESVIMEPK